MHCNCLSFSPNQGFPSVWQGSGNLAKRNPRSPRPKLDLCVLESSDFQSTAMFLAFITKVYCSKDQNKTFYLAGCHCKTSIITNFNIFIVIHKYASTSSHTNKDTSFHTLSEATQIVITKIASALIYSKTAFQFQKRYF